MIAPLPEWPLFGLADDIRPALRQALAAGSPVALATIVGLDGGGPRPMGTQMVIGAGVVSGFLSGGCLEADVAAHAAGVLETGTPARLVYGEGSPWPDIRLLCGARAEILLEAVAPDDAAMARLLTLAQARIPALWLSDGRRRLCGPLDDPPETWPGAWAKVFPPATRLIVVGADPSALAIASLGAQAGFETTLVRPRGPRSASPISGVAYRREPPAEALAALGLDPWTAVAVATHEAVLDHEALASALPSEAFFVGALGARRRAPERAAALAAAGLAKAHIARLVTPIGLDLGGKAPWEVAIAVLAQITAYRANGYGAPPGQPAGVTGDRAPGFPQAHRP
jgi:xanthine dehydrogenase accessory factor